MMKNQEHKGMGSQGMGSQDMSSQGMGSQQQSTGASNLEYDLLSEMHSLLKGNSALEQYIQDAKREGDREAESCFQQIHEQNKQNVQKLRELVTRRIAKAA